MPSIVGCHGFQLSSQYISVPDERKKVEVARRLADITKASAHLGFRAHISLREGLGRLVHWLNSSGIAMSGGS